MNIEKMFPEGEDLIYVDCSAVALNYNSFNSVRGFVEFSNYIKDNPRFVSSREVLDEIRLGRDHYRSRKINFNKGDSGKKVLKAFTRILGSLSHRTEEVYRNRDKSLSTHVSGFANTCKELSYPDKSLLSAALLNKGKTGIYTGDKSLIDYYIEGVSKFGFRDCFVCDRNLHDWEVPENNSLGYFFINSKDI